MNRTLTNNNAQNRRHVAELAFIDLNGPHVVEHGMWFNGPHVVEHGMWFNGHHVVEQV